MADDFHSRAIAGHNTALMVFTKDVEDTYNLLRKRVEANKDEMNKERETIQLVPAEEGQTITFDVPDGPPPAELQLSDDLKEYSVEQVREALQERWSLFMSLKPKLRKALKNGSLDEVNKVLGTMDVGEAETVVALLNRTGILNFADNGEVRDMTGRSVDIGA
jgi:cell division cycle protein 37